MTFTFAPALLLLLLLPLAAYIGWPRYGYRRARDVASLLLRLTILTLVVLAIGGAQIVRSADRLAVVFLVDVSDSIDAATQEAEFEFVRQAIDEMGVNDSAGIVLFGTNAVVERQVSAVRDLGPIQSAPSTNNTDLAEAIRLGLALFPTDAARRMVVLSDGRPTVGDTESAVNLAAAANVQIDYVTFAPERAPEVQVTDVDVPTTVNEDQQFDLNVTIEAEASTPARLSVLASGSVIYQENVDLSEGANTYALTLEAGDAGFRDFRVQVDPQSQDGFFQNNQLSAFSRVIGPPRVLLVTESEDEAQFLLPALEEAGLTVDVSGPNELPIGLAPLAQYNSVILSNVPARSLSPQRMETLESFVRDLGGGMVFVGGPDSYGPGGYFQTPIENALPLETRIRDQQRLPQLTLAYLIDTSGSMGAVGPSGVPNIELAKEAINRSIEFLQPTDRAGVASFDTAGSWIANIQPVLDRLRLQSLVGTLRAGGGTDILAGMRTVAGDIVPDESDRKHIILLTDGGASPQGLIELTTDIFENADVTTSVIAIGAGAADFLDDMASAGGGNYYMIDTIDQIPTIFTQETVLATRSYIQEEEFFPIITANSPIMRGINSSPPLRGYVATTPKQTAQVVLRGGEFEDPILASWQYGLGRTVAFTSDATSRWGAEWVQWDDFSLFWSQAVRWTITEGTSNNIETRVVMEGEQARVIVDARDEDGAFLNGENIQLSLVDPTLTADQINLQQIAPGRYEATFDPQAEGSYILRLAGQDGAINQTSGWVMSYSPEYNIRTSAAETGILSDLAELTGGRSIADAPSEAFAHTLRNQPASSPIWPFLLVVATLLLPLDIAARRLVVTRRDLAKLWERISGGAQVATQETSERMTSLITARDRAREQIDGQDRSPSSTVSALRRNRDARNEPRSAAPPVQAPKPDAPAPTKQRQEKPAEQGNIGARLLKRRRSDEDDA